MTSNDLLFTSAKYFYTSRIRLLLTSLCNLTIFKQLTEARLCALAFKLLENNDCLNRYTTLAESSTVHCYGYIELL